MRKILPVLPLAILLTGCATATSRLPVAPVPAAWAATPTNSGQTDTQWWRSAGDPVLDRLVADAEARNHEVAIARERLREARAGHVAARALLFPQVDAGGVAEHGDVGLTYSYHTLSIAQGELDAGFDLDLFGGLKARSNAAGATEKGARAGLEEVRAAIRLEVVSTYIGLRQTQLDLTSAMATQTAAARIATTREDQWRKGLITEADWRQARADADAASAAVSRLAAAQVQFEDALNLLTGNDELALTPTLDAPSPIPRLADDFAVTAPVAVVRQRPDIAAAEAALTAARAQTRAAQAQVFPDLSIQAFYGSQDTSVHPSTTVWNTAALIAMPLLNFGRVRAGIDAANAREMAAYEQYRLTVASALAEVHTRLAARDDARRRLDLSTRGEQARLRRLVEAGSQFKAGLVPDAAVEAAVIAHEASVRDLGDAQAEVSLRDAALMRAEGF